MKGYNGPPMTLGNAAAARVRLIVWCRACSHQIEPDPAEMAARYGGDRHRAAIIEPASMPLNDAVDLGVAPP